MGRSLNMALLAAILVAAWVQNSAAETTHEVGGASGWIIPSNGAASYSNWAANQTFVVGDILVFNFTTGSHDVAEVTKADYDACTSSNQILLETTGPASIKLNSSGEHYFICTYNGHCGAGQKLEINVTAATSPSPSPSPSPLPSTPSPAPQAATTTTPAPAPSPATSSSANTYIVGDSLGWTVPSNDSSAYQSWAANKTFKVGDILVFNYASGRHDVAEVTKAAYEPCNGTNPISLSATPPTNITLTTPGEHFFICTYSQHCPNGQHLAINVTGTATTPTTAPVPSPSDGAPSSPPTSTATPPTSSSSSTPPSSSTTPPETSPSSGSTSPPPPPNSASPLGVAGISASLLSIFVAFFLW